MTKDTSNLSEGNPFAAAKTMNDVARITASLLAQQANYLGGLSEITTLSEPSKQNAIYGQLTDGNNQIITWLQEWLVLPDDE